MKKLWKKVNRKVRYTIGSIVILALVILDSMNSKSVRENNQRKGEEVHAVVVSEEPEPSFATYDELTKDYEEDTADKQEATDVEGAIDEQISRQEQDDTALTDKSSVGDKVKVIDESDETMDDQTSDMEKEYDENEEPQGKIVITTPSKEEGKEVKDKTKPGGKQNVGTWG